MIVDIAMLTPQQLVCPPGLRRVEYVDQGGLGLYVEVRASSPGVGTFYLRYRTRTASLSPEDRLDRSDQRRGCTP